MPKKDLPGIPFAAEGHGGKARYVLRLFIAGTTARSMRAVANIRKLCEEHLAGIYDLDVIDVAENPQLATDEQIVATPTLIKKLPQPLRRFIGDLSQKDR